MRQIKTFCATVVALLLLSACGSKGPLYLPPKSDQANAPASAKDSNKDGNKAVPEARP